MNHDELSDLFASLPQERASDGFTTRTLARLEDRPPQRHRLRAAFAVAVAAIVILSGTLGIRHHNEQVRLARLRAEQLQIQKELNELKALTTEREPRVYVGSSGGYDFVVGLEAQSRKPTAAQPVSLHIANDAVF